MASSSDERRRSPAEILRALGIAPSKGLGQHFLHDAGIVRRIVTSAQLPPDSTAVEIGPGLGILTSELANAVDQVVAVEKDATLIAHLESTLPANVAIVEADALEVDFSQFSGAGVNVVANLPYNVGNAILRRLLETIPPFDSITIMVQREVAQRIAASPPDMSLLSIAVQFFGAPRVVMRVGKGAFLPPPNVESAVVRIVTQEPPLPPEAWSRFFDVARAGFAERRKQLANTLSSGLNLPKEQVIQVVQSTGTSATARAETLTLADWVSVYHALEPLRSTYE